jgi:hypothetical protein
MKLASGTCRTLEARRPPSNSLMQQLDLIIARKLRFAKARQWRARTRGPARVGCWGADYAQEHQA